MNIKQRFRSAIKYGTGKTHILIKENPHIDFSKEIIEGALTNFAYDQQSEGSRDIYIAGLINLSPQKDKILPIIYEALKNEESHDDWSTAHLFDTIAIFAKQGDIAAKQTIYEAFDKYAKDGDWFGDDAIVEIDGLKGLLYVADKKGEFLLKNSEAWEDSFFVDYFQEQNPDVNVYGELKKAAENNSNIKKYLVEIEECKFSPYKPNKKEEKYDYKYVKDRFSNKYLGIGPRIFELLSKKDLRKLADDFLKETSKVDQEKYLQIFSNVKYPYDYNFILNLAKSTYSKNTRIIELAVKALQFFKDNDIRQFALEILPITKIPEIYTSLLIGNYKKGDWKLLKSIAEKARNNNVIESLAISYIDIYQANQTKECNEPLEVIYEKMNCGLHRTTLLSILIENNVLSEKIRNEIQFDSNDGVRKLFINRLDS